MGLDQQSERMATCDSRKSRQQHRQTGATVLLPAQDLAAIPRARCQAGREREISKHWLMVAVTNFGQKPFRMIVQVSDW